MCYRNNCDSCERVISCFSSVGRKPRTLVVVAAAMPMPSRPTRLLLAHSFVLFFFSDRGLLSDPLQAIYNETKVVKQLCHDFVWTSSNQHFRYCPLKALSPRPSFGGDTALLELLYVLKSVFFLVLIILSFIRIIWLPLGTNNEDFISKYFIKFFFELQ